MFNLSESFVAFNGGALAYLKLITKAIVANRTKPDMRSSVLRFIYRVPAYAPRSTLIKCSQSFHIFFIERKIEDISVRTHALQVSGFGQWNISDRLMSYRQD
jgi:hypothetical protein